MVETNILDQRCDKRKFDMIDSQEAKDLNSRIFECIYYHALKQSHYLAKVDGPYDSFYRSPISLGIFQFDLWEGDTKLNYDYFHLNSYLMSKFFLKNYLLGRYN